MIKQYLLQLTTFLKDSFVVFLTTLIAFLGPVHEVIFAVLLLCLLDFFTGIYAAYKNKITITSNKMGNTFNKFALYGFVIIVSHYLDLHFISAIRVGFLDSLLLLVFDQESINILSSVKMSAAVAFLMAMREIKSIDENWEKSFQWSFIKYGKVVLSFFNFNKLKKTNNEVSS